MTFIDQAVPLEKQPASFSVGTHETHRAVQRRLSKALRDAAVLPFDDSSRYVFFSDLHRGDDGPADAFRGNKTIFLQALEHYYQEGYTYFEVGDGDELWKNRHMTDIRRAHAPIYALMDQFRRDDRLHLLIGNHQLIGRHTNHYQDRGLLGREAIVLKHAQTSQRILVTHGHQADGLEARAYGLTRMLVRHVWGRMQSLGMSNCLPEPKEHAKAGRLVQGAMAWSKNNQSKIERRIKTWIDQVRNLAVICGHTHRPAFAWAGNSPYFNTGSGIQPGYITGLEIANGAISLITWSNQPKEGPGAQSLSTEQVYRTVLEGPQSLQDIT